MFENAVNLMKVNASLRSINNAVGLNMFHLLSFSPVVVNPGAGTIVTFLPLKLLSSKNDGGSSGSL